LILNAPEGLSIAAAGALAAALLEEACRRAPVDPLRAEVVGGLARSLRAELEALAGPVGEISPADAGSEAALRAADVANLAASSLANLSNENVLRAVAAAHLAAGVARALGALAEVPQLDGERARYKLKDARSAAWRARFAIRQTDEFLESVKGEG